MQHLSFLKVFPLLVLTGSLACKCQQLPLLLKYLSFSKNIAWRNEALRKEIGYNRKLNWAHIFSSLKFLFVSLRCHYISWDWVELFFCFLSLLLLSSLMYLPYCIVMNSWDPFSQGLCFQLCHKPRKLNNAWKIIGAQLIFVKWENKWIK